MVGAHSPSRVQNTSCSSETFRFSASVVTFHTDLEVLRKGLDNLYEALSCAKDRGIPVFMQLVIVDNSNDPEYFRQLTKQIPDLTASRFDAVECFQSGENLGYGAGHNRALEHVDSQVHLVMNPDVELAEDALFVGLDYLRQHDDVVIVSPRATDSSGEEQYLCKRYPSVLLLALRGFAPQFIKRLFKPYLCSYEVRDADGTSTAADVMLVSGCCMFVRTDALRRAGGFSEEFFMYFEDFDLSLRLHPEGKLVYLPALQIVHHGGYAASKGWRHISMFVQSGWKFFWRHGWRWT